MVRRIIKMLKSVHRLLSHYSQVTKLFQGINGSTCSQSRGQIKSKFSVIIDYLYLFFILKILPTNYYLFQFDCKDRKQFKEHMDEPVSPVLKHKLYACLWDDNYSSLVNDKYVFHCFCRYHNILGPELYGVYRNGVFIGEERNLAELMSRKKLEKVILKPVRGIQGKGIYIVSHNTISKLEKNNEMKALQSLSRDLKEKHYIVQEVIKQHSELNKINPHSVNTIRIITFLTRENKVEFLAAMLRTSSSHSPIDNFHSGGIVIGIDMQTGRLKQPGFFDPQYGTTVTKHPVTNTQFYNFQIPHWEEVKEMATNAQKCFNYLKSIGWDFAITPNGPVIIEGNIEWGTAGIQAANGGLLTPRNRALFLQYGLSF